MNCTCLLDVEKVSELILYIFIRNGILRKDQEKTDRDAVIIMYTICSHRVTFLSAPFYITQNPSKILGALLAGYLLLSLCLTRRDYVPLEFYSRLSYSYKSLG